MINTPLPVQYRPNTDGDGGTVIRHSDHIPTSLNPIPVSLDSSSQLGLTPLCLGPTALLPQPTKPRLLLQRTQPVHQVTSCREVLEPSWAEPVPAPGLLLSAATGVCAGGNWLHPEPPHHRPCSRNSSSSGSQRLKNKTKNLWNPTYGSWVLENFRGKKTLAHTQSMPLSGATSTTSNTPAQCGNTTTECNEDGCDKASPPSSSCKAPAAPTATSHKSPAAVATAGNSKAGIDLAKLQSFPCGNVNYAYDEQSYEAESLPLVMPPRATEVSTSTSSVPSVSSGISLGLALGLHASSSCMPKLLLKRHASYGHEDMRRHTKAEKPTRDRDSGFSLSEDLSVTPI